MLYVLRIGRDDVKNLEAFALGVVVLKRFSVKEVVT